MNRRQEAMMLKVRARIRRNRARAEFVRSQLEEARADLVLGYYRGKEALRKQIRKMRQG